MSIDKLIALVTVARRAVLADTLRVGAFAAAFCAALTLPTASVASEATAVASTASRTLHCGSQYTGSYYSARKVTGSHITCRRARRVAGEGARTLDQLGVQPGNGSFGMAAAGTGWFCDYSTAGSDIPFRVRCVQEDIGRGRVNFTAVPGE